MFLYETPLRETEHVEVRSSLTSDIRDLQPSVSIIVPTLNEVDNIDQILADIVENVRGLFDFEVIVTDGGSTDGTCEKVRHWEKRHPVRLVRNHGNGGLAADVQSAAAMARFPILVVLDADGSHPVASIPDLVHPVLAGLCEMAIGSRYVEGGLTTGWPFHRRFLSRLGAAFASPFTDVKDPLSGFFAVRREYLLAAGGHAEGFKIGLEAIFAGGDTLTVREVPISFSDRLRGRTKIGINQFTAYIGQLLRFSRGTSSSTALQRFLVVGMAGFILDFLIVSMMRALGADITVAHISGFCLAAIFNYMAHAQWSFEGRATGRTRFTRFLFLSALALTMRGGLIATTTDLGLPFFWVMLMGIAGGGVVSYVGNEFYVFRSNLPLSPTIRWKLAAVAVASYVLVLRIVYQGSIDVLPQEAYYWNYAQYPAMGYLDHPPMVAWLIWLGTSVFGDSEFGVRIGATMCWLATAFFVFRFTHNLFGRTPAFFALLLFSVLPFFFAIGAMMTPDAPLTAAWAGALYFLERALIGNRKRAWLGAGACIGLGMLSKYTIALLGPAAMVFLIIHPESRRWFFSKWPYLGVILAAALFSPVILWNATNDWASFAFQGSRRWLAEDINFSTHTLVSYIAALIGPIGIWLAAHGMIRLVRLHDRFATRSQAVFIIVFTLEPLSVFLGFSLLHGVKLNWTGPIWLTLLPAMASVVAITIKDGRTPHLVAALKVGTATSTLLFALLLHYLALGLPFVGYSGSLRGLPVAWEEFVSDAELIKTQVVMETGVSPMLVGMDTYNIASELRFYRGKGTALSDITSQNFLGKNGLMFGVWASEFTSSPKAVIMYGLKESSLSADRLEGRFERIGPIRTRVVEKNAVAAGKFFYRVGYGLRQLK
ncbi:glycosyltransferase family 39 protein [Agrobacterium tumefaciens]|uniref:glycosyltransferase family 39 protein n=1 Tax=Agrobacterium tumefaciens TaxID=358 RepID=UPI001573550B|nr:glycosyltransferase [Agrobacterium tumefaciens]